MKIVIIGSGNVATIFGHKAKAAGHEIVQVIARREEAASGLAAELAVGGDASARKIGYATQLDKITPEADVYIIAVSDSALPEIADQLSLPGKLVLHTAGAVPASILLGVSSRSGVLYPLQSLRAEIRPFPEIPLLIDANSPEDLPAIEEFARTLSDKVEAADDGRRLKLHVGAVVVNNFVNYLYTLTRDFCRSEKMDFSLLLPLIEETAARLHGHDPRQVQTGPAIRGDYATIARHRELLEKYEPLKAVYDLLTSQIRQFYRPQDFPSVE